MAAVVRSTASYSVPPTQNTAPVLEFRCLYTHDIHKKQKKWHDGSLRFHTFNRRVMVYDDTKNYIGDLHYRGDDEFGEGTELQLDRPVKVEVGEPLGETQTDLRPILDRGRAERNAAITSQGPATARSIRRINAGTNGGKPKTLSEVLGGSQGRLGRAKLPVQSPYEQRMTLAEVNDGRPAAKRPRLYTGKENQILAQNNTSNKPNNHISCLASPQQVNRSQSRLMPAPESRAQVSRSTVSHTIPPRCRIVGDHDLGETRNYKRPSTASKQVENSLPRSPDIPLRKSSATNGRGQDDPIIRQKDRKSISSSRSNRIPEQRDQHLGGVHCATKFGTTGTLQPGMTSLKMRPQQRRRKLLYKARIPDTDKDASTVSLSALREEPSVASDKQTSAAGSERHQALVESHLSIKRPNNNFDVIDIDDTLESEHRPQSKSRYEPDRYTGPSLSPLFLSQQLSQRNTASEPMPCDDGTDFTLDLVDGTQISAASSCVTQDKARESEQQTSAGSVIQDTVLDNPKTAAEDKVRFSAATTPPPQTIQISLIGPEQSAPPVKGNKVLNTEIQTNQLRQAVSKANPPLFRKHNEKNQQLSEGSIVTDCSIPPSTGKSQPQHTIPEETSLQAHSETAAVIPLPVVNTKLPPQVQESLATLNHAVDQGPWSKLEAFLLFETWPASKAKDKPSFVRPTTLQGDEDFDDYDGIDEHIDLSIDTSLRNVRTRTENKSLPGIRSARSVLRDEV